MIDVCMNCFIAYRNKEGQVVQSQCKIIKHYLGGWFLIDVTAAVPVDWITAALQPDESRPSGGKFLRLLRTLRFIKLGRILRVGKLGAVADLIEQELVGSSMRLLGFAIMKIILFLFYVAHVAGCFWYLVGVSFEEHYGQSWLTEKMPQYKFDEWMAKNTKYMWSWHFAMATMTTVGYGDVSPTNTAELAYTLCLLWVSLIVFSASIGILMNLITSIY